MALSRLFPELVITAPAKVRREIERPTPAALRRKKKSLRAPLGVSSNAPGVVRKSMETVRTRDGNLSR